MDGCVHAVLQGRGERTMCSRAGARNATRPVQLPSAIGRAKPSPAEQPGRRRRRGRGLGQLPHSFSTTRSLALRLRTLTRCSSSLGATGRRVMMRTLASG